MPLAERVATMACALAAGSWDAARGRVPNALSLTGLVAGIAVHWYTQGLQGLGSSLAAAVLAAAWFGWQAGRGWLGWGDVKGATALAACVGLSQTPALVAGTIAAGGALAIGVSVKPALVRGSVRARRSVPHRRSGWWAAWRDPAVRARPCPYACALGLAAAMIAFAVPPAWWPLPALAGRLGL